MRNSSSLDWLRFMHTPNDYRVSRNYSCMNKEFQFKPKMERTPWLTSRRVMEKRSGKTRSSPHGKRSICDL